MTVLRPIPMIREKADHSLADNYWYVQYQAVLWPHLSMWGKVWGLVMQPSIELVCHYVEHEDQWRPRLMTIT